MLFVNRILDSYTALMEVSECNLKELCCNKNPGCETSTHYLIVTFYIRLKEARNSFFGLGVYLLKSKFRIEGKLRFP